MRYSQLRAFHAVAVHGGFSRAAEALSLTQPAVSEQVRKLEQDHDVLLFRRERKRVRPTGAGERLFILTQRFFEAEQQVAEYLSESRSVTAGEIRIIVDSAHHITDILHRFRRRFPNVVVTLRTGNSEDVLASLRSYRAEVGVVGSPSPGRDMDEVSLGVSRIVAFAARDLAPDAAALNLCQLAEMPLILRETGSKTRQKLEEEAARRGIRLKAAIEAEGREAVREIVASGAGVGFVSEAEFGEDDRFVRIALQDVDIRMSETLICLGQRRDVGVIRAFMDLARVASTAS